MCRKKGRSGLAILSMYPLSDTVAHFFPASTNGLGYVMSEVVVGEDAILLVNLHLDRNERVRARKAMPRVPWKTAFGVMREELFEETRGNGPASVVFSGDLGPPDTPLLPDPDVPDSCDLLVMESTYGDRVHEDRKERIMRLGEVLTRALEDRGKVYIPAFSLGRTQELLYEMDRLFSEPGWTGGRIPVFLDSPLGLEITRVYSSLSEYWDREARGLLANGDHPLKFDHLYAVRSYRDHQRVLGVEGPVIVVAGSGMCTGGRIVNHLKHGLGDERNDILFVGYQAQGTPGRDIQRYSRRPDGYVVLDGERFPIRARVSTLGGYSAHADREDLIRWARAVGPKQIKLVHGEAEARQALGAAVGLGQDGGRC